jgi:hypothetical protein
MNKQFLMLAVILTFGFSRANAQQKIDKDTELNYDLLNSAGTFPGDFSIKKDVRIRYKISNINRNVYTVTTSSESKSMFVDKPPLFNLISDIDMSKLTPSVPTAPDAATGDPLSNLKKQTDDSGDEIIQQYLAANEKLNQLIQLFDRTHKKLRHLNSYYRSLTAMLTDGTTPFATLQATRLSSAHALLTADFSYSGSATDEGALLAALSSNTEDVLQTLENTYQEIIRKQNEVKQRLLAVEQLSTEATTKLSKAPKSEKPEAKKTREQALVAIKNEIMIEKLYLEGSNDVINDIKVMYAKIQEINQSGFVQTLVMSYRKINPSNWEYISPSIKAEKDILKIKMNIEPKEATIFSSNYSQFNGEYTGKVYGFKVNFSTGLFALLGDSLFDHSYKLDTLEGDTQNNIIVKNKNHRFIQPAVGALMHFYNKKPGDFSWGGNFGFSVSGQTRLNYPGGFSFLFGEEQRIILNIGATLTQVKDISNEYTKSQKLPRGKITTIPTDNFYRAGGFFAVTYNLSN